MDALVVRSVTCPLCATGFKVHSPKSGSYSLISRDADLCPHYQGTNPLHYAVWVCPECHYAAFKDDWQPTEDLVEQLRPLMHPPEGRAVDFHQAQRSLFAAITSYRLAARFYAARPRHEETRAGIQLTLAWLCRLGGDARHEVQFQQAALEGFQAALDTGRPMHGKFGDVGAMYLVGELSLRLGQRDQAHQYLTRSLAAARKTTGMAEVERWAQQRVYELKAIQKRREALAAIDFLAPLGEDERSRLAAGLHELHFESDEVVCTRGSAGDSLFILAAGTVRVHLEGAPDEAVDLDELDDPVAVLESGQFFGEMSLLTGQPRMATVVAEEGAELLVVDKPAFRALLQANPDVLREIAEVFERRKAANNGTLAAIAQAHGQAHDAGAVEPVAAGHHEGRNDSLANRIASFFHN